MTQVTLMPARCNQGIGLSLAALASRPPCKQVLFLYVVGLCRPPQLQVQQRVLTKHADKQVRQDSSFRCHAHMPKYTE